MLNISLPQTIATTIEELNIAYPYVYICFYGKPEAQRMGDPAICTIYPKIDGTFDFIFESQDDPDFGEDFQQSVNSIEEIVQYIPFDMVYDLFIDDDSFNPEDHH